MVVSTFKLVVATVALVFCSCSCSWFDYDIDSSSLSSSFSSSNAGDATGHCLLPLQMAVTVEQCWWTRQCHCLLGFSTTINNIDC